MQNLLNKTTLEKIIEISKLASNEILKIYNSEIEVIEKKDNSPLTQADLASHRLIVKELKKLTPNLPILSEESAEIEWTERQKWETYWLIDPLDGTKEFVKRNGEFTVNIALIHGDQSVLGVVYAPVTDSYYAAAKGINSFKGTPDGKRIKCKVDAHENGSKWKVVGSRSHTNKQTEEFLNQLEDYEIIPMGSSLKLCMVAEGAADLYPRIGLTSEWDTAAAQCVVEQAGGHVLDLDMSALKYNSKESLLNSYFIVCGDNLNYVKKFKF
ncbi:MAG: 3'(2'),5'-bisphosphate nucleotidase CysQ [Desulfobacterales bacterium]|nr:3'(2'),5'-bisphosphate nucleotidase CysQ [Desulfobacterales bacterium]